MIYCYLRWRGDSLNDAGTKAKALAQCDEDTLGEYQIDLNLKNSQLTIRWSDSFSTQALQICQ